MPVATSTDQLELPRFSRCPASRIDRIKAGAGLDQKPDAVRAVSNRRNKQQQNSHSGRTGTETSVADNTVFDLLIEECQRSNFRYM